MKVDEYQMRGAIQDIIDFKDQVTLIMNNGRYSNLVVSTPPTWKARQGEAVFYLDSANNVRRWYFYLNNAWNAVDFGDQFIRGWINFNGTNGAVQIYDSFNVTSLVRTALGKYTINWTTFFTNTAYCLVGSAKQDAASNMLICGVSSAGTTGTAIELQAHDSSNQDGNPVGCLTSGDQAS